VFYDITASPEGRSVDRRWIHRVAEVLDIPFCVAGGIRSVRDAEEVLNFGADKISINTPALTDPALITELARRFGTQCVVVGIDSREEDGEWRVYQFTGDPAKTRASGLRTEDWIVEAQRRGAGEIVLNCMNQDGVRRGYDLAQLKAMRAVTTRTAHRFRRRRCTGTFPRCIRPGRCRWRTGRQRVSQRRHQHPHTQDLAARRRHRGTTMNTPDIGFLLQLEQVIAARKAESTEASYTARLFKAGTARIAQKVGEEGVELALASVTDGRDKVISEAADLLYHMLVLLQSREASLAEVVSELERRHK
jgi:phosphoribosyl-ATP pyrophosphohydrolase